MVGQPLQTAARFGARITTVDPAQGLVAGVMKGDAQERRFLVVTTPLAFRWPQVGESWMVEQKNGTWYLDGLWPTTEAPKTYQDVDPGDLVLNTPSGVVHVLGSDGSTDFEIRPESFPLRGVATLAAGTATVRIPEVTTSSQIFLTAQDNLSTGSLRVSARVPNVSFTITSSNNGDQGMVAYQMYTATVYHVTLTSQLSFKDSFIISTT